ncbi:hypothetical protein FRC06_000996 [Ceratobasidium sp. 370]|nr:hypothetical protein FRC06_000996 [Ceratobasidium sp. 370]
MVFLRTALWSLFKQYILLDMFDALSRLWDAGHRSESTERTLARASLMVWTNLNERPCAFPAPGGVGGPANAPSLEAFGAHPSFHALARPKYAAFTLQEEPEPEVVRYIVRQIDAIATRDEESKANRAEAIAQAERDVGTLHEGYNRKMERQIRESQENEAKYLSNLTDSLSVGTRLSGIYDLIDFRNSQSKGFAHPSPGRLISPALVRVC